MAPRLLRTVMLVMLIFALLAPSPSRAGDKELRSTIAFASSRDFPTALAALNSGEIYLMNPTADPTLKDPLRLTDNESLDTFPTLSPDGKKIVFDSNRLVPSGYSGDLFLMNTDGTEQVHLTQGSSSSWSPDSKDVAFYASASGTGALIKGGTGPVTSDSDIFVINVDECLEDVDACQDVNGPIKRNLTNNGDAKIDDDPDWSPDGRKIVFTSHVEPDGAPGPNQGNDNPTTEIYVMNADGTGDAINLTNNDLEERSPDWSPDGERIAFMCRPGAVGPFQICIMNKGGSNRRQLIYDKSDPYLSSANYFHATPVWSPDGEQIAFSRRVSGQPDTIDLWLIDNVDDCLNNPANCQPVRLTDTPESNNTEGVNIDPNWGVVRITGQGEGQGAAGDAGTGHDGTADHGQQDKHKKDKHAKHKKDKPHKGGGKRHR